MRLLPTRRRFLRSRPLAEHPENLLPARLLLALDGDESVVEPVVNLGVEVRGVGRGCRRPGERLSPGDRAESRGGVRRAWSGDGCGLASRPVRGRGRSRARGEPGRRVGRDRILAGAEAEAPGCPGTGRLGGRAASFVRSEWTSMLSSRSRSSSSRTTPICSRCMPLNICIMNIICCWNWSAICCCIWPKWFRSIARAGSLGLSGGSGGVDASGVCPLAWKAGGAARGKPIVEGMAAEGGAQPAPGIRAGVALPKLIPPPHGLAASERVSRSENVGRTTIRPSAELVSFPQAARTGPIRR